MVNTNVVMTVGEKMADADNLNVGAPAGASAAPAVTSEPVVDIVQQPEIPHVVTPALDSVPAESQKQEDPKLDKKPVDTFLKVEDPVKIPEDGAKSQPDPEPKSESQSVESAPLPTFESFALPDEFSVDPVKMQDFTGLLGKFENTIKADHAEVQKFGQELVDYHISQIKTIAEEVSKQTAQSISDQAEKVKSEWRAQVENRNDSQTLIADAKEGIGISGISADKQKAFLKALEETGAGLRIEVIEYLADQKKILSEGKMLSARTPANMSKPSKIQALYGSRSR
jgi:hypothetical protein